MLSPLTKHSLFGFLLLFIPSSQAATLFQGGTIIAWDNSTQSLNVIRNGSILVDGNTITSIFSGPYNGTLGNVTTVDCNNDIITPGFIDTHRHSWQTAWKSIGSNTSLAEYFGRYATNAPASRIFTPEDVYIGQLLGLHEALNAGVTTVLDFAHHSWTAEHAQAGLRATIESGIRAVYAYYLQEYPRFSWNSSVELFRGIARNGTSKEGRVDIGISYDNFVTGVEAQTSQVLSLAREYSIPVLTTHTVGHVYGGDNSPSVLHSLGFLNQSHTAIVFAHGSYVTASDAQLLRQTNQFISITPESEMHYGHDHPDSHLMQDQAALGVDTHFTFSTDILTQARMWLQVVRRTLYREVLERRRVPPNNPMSATQAFLLATRNGALSMHREDIGILSPGAKADLVIWNGRSPAMLGWSDPVAAVILHASVGDIKHVVVNGEFRKRDGRLVVEGYEALQERFLTSARRLQQIWRDTPLPVLEGEWNGNPVERTFEADVLRGNGTGYGQSYA